MQRRGITRQVILRRVTEALKRLSFGEAGHAPTVPHYFSPANLRLCFRKSFFHA